MDRSQWLSVSRPLPCEGTHILVRHEIRLFEAMPGSRESWLSAVAVAPWSKQRMPDKSSRRRWRKGGAMRSLHDCSEGGGSCLLKMDPPHTFLPTTLLSPGCPRCPRCPRGPACLVLDARRCPALVALPLPCAALLSSLLLTVLTVLTVLSVLSVLSVPSSPCCSGLHPYHHGPLRIAQSAGQTTQGKTAVAALARTRQTKRGGAGLGWMERAGPCRAAQGA